MKRWFLAWCMFSLLSSVLLAQNTAGVAYSRKTGDPGFDGFEFSGEHQFASNFRLVAEITPYFKTTRAASVKTSSKEQDFMFGPRFAWSGLAKNPKLVPFGHLLYGVAHTTTNVKTINGPTLADSSDTSWAWQLGGGVEYVFRPKWKVRGKIDIFRSHFVDLNQTNAKYGVGIVYCFGQPCQTP
jgi:opacity protein-like surface antigen